eukprot:227769-Amorphochlora_amoeboformis.AAC.3
MPSFQVEEAFVICFFGLIHIQAENITREQGGVGREIDGDRNRNNPDPNDNSKVFTGVGNLKGFNGPGGLDGFYGGNGSMLASESSEKRTCEICKRVFSQ